jgi:hypothetical protein
MGVVTAEMRVQFRKSSQHLTDVLAKDPSAKLSALQDKLNSISDETASVLQKMEGKQHFRAFQLTQAINHRTNYRALFESGDMPPIVDFLSQETVPTICLVELHDSTGIPLNTLKSWRHGLRSDPPCVPYAQPANISKRGLTPEQEEALAQRIRSDDIGKKNIAHRGSWRRSPCRSTANHRDRVLVTEWAFRGKKQPSFRGMTTNL